MHDHVMQCQGDGLQMQPCGVFVVIRNGMKSVFMCECNLYGWVFFQGRYIYYKNMVYICNNILCAHRKTRQQLIN